MIARSNKRKTNKARKPKYAQPWYKKKYNAMELASKAASGVWHLKGLINSEKKIHQVLNSNSATYSGILETLSAVAQGDTEITRDGNSIYARYLNIRGSIMRSDSSTQQTNVRLMVILDNSVNPSSSTVSDVLAQSTVGTLYAPYGPLNRDTGRNRFKVLYTSLFAMDATDAVHPFKLNVEMRHHCKFTGSGSTDYKSGVIYLLCISDEATNGVTARYMSRLTYYDN